MHFGECNLNFFFFFAGLFGVAGDFRNTPNLSPVGSKVRVGEQW